MGFRFRKSIKIIPGVRLNLGKRGASASIGRRGATMNVGRRGVRTTVGLPGTGLSYSSQSSWSDQAQRRVAPQPSREYTTNEMLFSLTVVGVVVLLVGLDGHPWVLGIGLSLVAFFWWAAIVDARAKAAHTAGVESFRSGQDAVSPVERHYPPPPRETIIGRLPLPAAATRRLVPLLAERTRIVAAPFTVEGMRRVSEIDSEVTRIRADF